MRNRAILFRLFFVAYASSVPLLASLVESYNVELTRGEQWDRHGKRIVEADTLKRTSTEERGMTQEILPVVKAITKAKAPEKLVPRTSLRSRRNPLNWVQRLWLKLRLWYTRYRAWKFRLRTSDDRGIDPALMSGMTPLSIKKLLDDIFRYSKIGPLDKNRLMGEYNTFVKYYVAQFRGLDEKLPVARMDGWNRLVNDMSWLERLTTQFALLRVRQMVEKGYSFEKLLASDISPLLYMRLLDRKGAFNDVDKNFDAIEQLKGYIKFYKKHITMYP